MSRRVIVAALACAVPMVAHADERCAVTYVTAPDGASDAIAGWVAAEPNCRGAISLRVIPTREGFYLFAERPDGTVHERVVPDLTAAGVLVASWVSDAWQPEPPHTEAPAPAPRAAPILAPAGITATAQVARPALPRWISLGGTLVPSEAGSNVGFRLEVDLVARGAWKLGVAAQKITDAMYVAADDGLTQGQIDDWSAGVIGSRTLRWNRWELRGAVGVFLLGSRLHETDFTGGAAFVYGYDIGVSPAVEVSATLARDLGDRWGLALSVGAMVISQEWQARDASAQQMTITRDETQPVGVVSVRRKI